MSFTFNTAVPATNNNPSNDQPDMQTNNVSTNAILAVDHISFNTDNGGNHLQMHLPFFTAPTIVNGQNTEGSIVYSAAGTANTGIAQGFFRNANNLNFPFSFIRAWAICSSAGVTNSQSFNVTSVVRNSAGVYTVTIPANVVSTTTYAVIISCSQGSSVQLTGNYTITGLTTFRLTFLNSNDSGADPDSFVFAVTQL